jgi:hypothetical protein
VYTVAQVELPAHVELDKSALIWTGWHMGSEHCSVHWCASKYNLNHRFPSLPGNIREFGSKVLAKQRLSETRHPHY